MRRAPYYEAQGERLVRLGFLSGYPFGVSLCFFCAGMGHGKGHRREEREKRGVLGLKLRPVEFALTSRV
ncbi:unnamed protein product [Camellia sinensis]